MSEWKEYSFLDAVEVNPGARLLKGADYPFVDMAAIQPSAPTVAESEIRTFGGAGSRFQPFDTLMARITPCLENGKIARFVPSATNHREAFGSTEFIVIRGKEGVTDNDFAYYLTKWDEFHRFAISKMSGSSGRQRVPVDALAMFRFLLPPPSVQKRIAEILGSLDEKIELNRRTSATLEQMAQALFRSWFVDFDPVKAKAAGKRPKNLAPEIFRLFPKEFEDSPLGPVPKGWEIRPLYDVATFINGAAFKNSHFSTEPDALPIIKIAEIKNGISPQTKFTKADLPEKYFIENGTILFSWSGSPETSIDTFVWTGGSGVLNQHIFRVDLLEQSDECFVYFLLKHLKSRFIEIAKNKQTTGLGHVTVQDMKKIMVPNPPPAVLDAYNEIAVPIFDKWYLLQNEINTLSALRDTLLPKLMNGEVDV